MSKTSLFILVFSIIIVGGILLYFIDKGEKKK